MAFMIVEFSVKIRVDINPEDEDAKERTAEHIQTALEYGIQNGRDDGMLTDDQDDEVYVLEDGVTLVKWYEANGEIPL